MNLPDVGAGLEVLCPNRETFVIPLLKQTTQMYYPDNAILPFFPWNLTCLVVRMFWDSRL